jgi:hypothetical protein
MAKIDVVDRLTWRRLDRTSSATAARAGPDHPVNDEFTGVRQFDGLGRPGEPAAARIDSTSIS